MRVKNIPSGVKPYEKAFKRACELEWLTWAAEGDADSVEADVANLCRCLFEGAAWLTWMSQARIPRTGTRLMHD